MRINNSEIEKEENLIKVGKIKTELEKTAFIKEIKNGLGEEIKANPNTVEFIQKVKPNKLKILVRKFFKIF